MAEAAGKERKSSSNAGRKKNLTKDLQSRMSFKMSSFSSRNSEDSETSFIVKKQSEFERIARAPRYQNTYRLDSKYPFKSGEVKKIIASIVDREVKSYPQYETNVMSKLAQLISGEVRSSVRHLNYDRYKICVLVLIGENKLQGFHSAFRAMWDPERDSWATYHWQCRTYFISCTCFGLYHD